MDIEKNVSVGPSALLPGIADFYAQSFAEGLPVLSHRGAEFSAMVGSVLARFREVFAVPQGYEVFFLGSSTESWDVLVRGCANESTSHVINGNFGASWANISEKTGRTVERFTREDGARFPLSGVRPSADFLAITANETSTGIAYTNAEIAALCAELPPETLLAVDVTSSFGAVEYSLDNADAWHFSVQKCFGLPPGLGVLVVSARCLERAKARAAAGADVGTHHALPALAKIIAKCQTPTTPNTLGIAGLGFACDFLKKMGGMAAVHAGVAKRATTIYAHFDAHPQLRPAVPTGGGRSETIVVLRGSEQAVEAAHQQAKSAGVVISTGYGGAKKTEIRLANFAVHSPASVEALLGAFGY